MPQAAMPIDAATKVLNRRHPSTAGRQRRQHDQRDRSAPGARHGRQREPLRQQVMVQVARRRTTRWPRARSAGSTPRVNSIGGPQPRQRQQQSAGQAQQASQPIDGRSALAHQTTSAATTAQPADQHVKRAGGARTTATSRSSGRDTRASEPQQHQHVGKALGFEPANQPLAGHLTAIVQRVTRIAADSTANSGAGTRLQLNRRQTQANSAQVSNRPLQASLHQRHPSGQPAERPVEHLVGVGRVAQEVARAPTGVPIVLGLLR